MTHIIWIVTHLRDFTINQEIKLLGNTNMINFKGWISNTYPHYLKEDNNSFSSNPQVVPATQEDVNYIKFNLRSILYKIVNVTPSDLLISNRDDPEKFQKDAANMKSTSPDKQTRMTMSQGNMGKPVTIYVIDDDGWNEQERRFNAPKQLAITRTTGNTPAIMLRRSLFRMAPSSEYPLGILTDQGKQVLAHEAGHAAQVGSQASAGRNAEYQNRDPEIGTRLAKLKNINTKKTLISLISSQSNGNKYALYAIKVLPDDETERFKALLIKPQWLNYLKSAQKSEVTDDQFVYYYIDPAIQALSRHDPDIGDLFNTVGKSNGVDGMVEKLIYAYDRVAKGNTENQGDQERQMA